MGSGAVKSVGVHIHQHGGEPEQPDDFGRGDVGKRRYDHLIAGLQAEGHEGDLKGVGTVGHRDDLRTIEKLAEMLSK